MYAWLRPLLFLLDAETAHRVTLAALDAGHRAGMDRCVAIRAEALPTTAFGIDFPNPVGLAAGLDKNAEHLDALGAMGFGYIEVGTVTPRAQPGNARPRMFRLPEHTAIINRLGFNNAGVDALLRHVERAKYAGVLGINIGRNKDTPNEGAIDDYRYCLERVHARADYVTVNISSPNTQGLRDLQHEDALKRLIHPLRDLQEKLASRDGKRTPMLLKIAPDLDSSELDAIARVVIEANVDGVICSNTTIDRSAVADARFANESGGLSGRPLLEKSTRVLREMRQRVGERIALIGIGGITCGIDAIEKIDAGATLVQLYTGLVYRGPTLIAECIEAIRAREAGLRRGT